MAIFFDKFWYFNAVSWFRKLVTRSLSFGSDISRVRTLKIPVFYTNFFSRKNDLPFRVIISINIYLKFTLKIIISNRILEIYKFFNLFNLSSILFLMCTRVDDRIVSRLPVAAINGHSIKFRNNFLYLFVVSIETFIECEHVQ